MFLTDTPVVAKIGDLGVAKVLKSAFTQTVIGTPFYISPEIWRKQPYNSKSDMWSLGCVLYEMCMLRHPFNASSPKELSQKILRCSYPPVIGYSDDMKNMVNNLLCVEAATRPSATDVLADPLIKCRMNLIPKACVPSAAELAPARTATTAASLTAGTFGSARPASGSVGATAASGCGGSASSSSSSTGAAGEGVSPPRPPEASTRSAAATEQILKTIAVPRNLSRIHLPPPAYVTPVSEQRTMSFLDEVQTVPGGMSVSKLCLDDETVGDASEPPAPPKPVEHSPPEERVPREEQQQVLPAAAAVVPPPVVPSVSAVAPVCAPAVEKSVPVVPTAPAAVPVVSVPLSHPAAPVEVPLAHAAAPEPQPLGQPPAKRHFKFDSQPFKDPPVPAAAEPVLPERRVPVRRSVVPHPVLPDDAQPPADRHPAQRFVFRRPSIVPPVAPASAAPLPRVNSSSNHTSSSRAHEVQNVPQPQPPVVPVPEAPLPVCAHPAEPVVEPAPAPAPAPAPQAPLPTAPAEPASAPAPVVEPAPSRPAPDAFVAPVGVPAHAPISDRDRHNMMVQKFLRQRRHSVFFRPPQLLAAALESAPPPVPEEPAPRTEPPAHAPAPAPAPAPRHSVAVRRPSVVPLLARHPGAAENSPAHSNAAAAAAVHRTRTAGSSSSGGSGFAEPLPVAFGTKHAPTAAKHGREGVAPRRPSVAFGPVAGSAHGAPARRPSVVPGAGTAHRSTAGGGSASSSSGRRASVVPGGRKSTLPVWR